MQRFAILRILAAMSLGLSVHAVGQTADRETIQPGDMAVVHAEQADVTDDGQVIAKLPQGTVFRVLRVSGDSVYGWIHIPDAFEIVWLKRGHEAGWVLQNQVRLATAEDLQAAAERARRAREETVWDQQVNDAGRQEGPGADEGVSPSPAPPSEDGRTDPAPPDRVGDVAEPSRPSDTVNVPPDRDAIPQRPSVPPSPQPPTTDMGSLRSSATGFAGHFASRTLEGKERRLCASISEVDRSEVQRLLADGADIDGRSQQWPTMGMTILQLAVWYEWDLASVKLALEANADVDAKDARGNTALIYAIAKRPAIDPAVVRTLLEAGADVNCHGARGMTALMHAATHDDPESLQMLLTAGAALNAQDSNGWTPLMHATRRAYGFPRIVALLIESGADVEAKHHCGGTALGSAAYNGHLEAVESLLAAGADVNVADVEGGTPLIRASLNGRQDVVKALVDAGADVNAEDLLGRTPLSASSNRAFTEVAELLVNAGAR